MRWKGVSLNCRRSSDSQEIRKVGSHSAAPDANLAKRQHHRNRQASSERHRRTHHAARRLWHVAIVPGDDRMHLRLGQAARHDAQDQTSRPSQRRYRLHAQSDRLQPDPHSQTASGIGRRLLTTSRPPQTPRQKDGKCTNLQVLQRTARHTLWRARPFLIR